MERTDSRALADGEQGVAGTVEVGDAHETIAGGDRGAGDTGELLRHEERRPAVVRAAQTAGATPDHPDAIAVDGDVDVGGPRAEPTCGRPARAAVVGRREIRGFTVDAGTVDPRTDEGHRDVVAVSGDRRTRCADRPAEDRLTNPRAAAVGGSQVRDPGPAERCVPGDSMEVPVGPGCDSGVGDRRAERGGAGHHVDDHRVGSGGGCGGDDHGDERGDHEQGRQRPLPTGAMRSGASHVLLGADHGHHAIEPSSGTSSHP